MKKILGVISMLFGVWFLDVVSTYGIVEDSYLMVGFSIGVGTIFILSGIKMIFNSISTVSTIMLIILIATSSFASSDKQLANETSSLVFPFNKTISLGQALVNFDYRLGKIDFRNESEGGRIMVRWSVFEDMNKCSNKYTVFDKDTGEERHIFLKKKILSILLVREKQSDGYYWKIAEYAIMWMSKDGRTGNDWENWSNVRIPPWQLLSVYENRCF